MAMHALQVFLYLLLATCVMSKEVLSATCQAPAVFAGDAGKVVCMFDTNVQEIRPVHISMDFYAKNQNDPDEVAACIGIQAGGLQCTTKEGLKFSTGDGEGTMVLTIAETTFDQEGRYVCKAMSPHKRTTLQPCQLSVYDRNATPPPTEDEHSPADTRVPSASDGLGWGSILGIVIGVAVLVGILVILVIFIWRRRVAGLRKKDPESCSGSSLNGDSTISIEEPLTKQATPVWVRLPPKDSQDPDRQPLIARDDPPTPEDVQNDANSSMQKEELLGFLESTENPRVVEPDIVQRPEHIEQAGSTSPVQVSPQFTGPRNSAALQALQPTEDEDEAEREDTRSPSPPPKFHSGAREHIDHLIDIKVLVQTTNTAITPKTLKCAKERLKKTNVDLP